MPYSVGNSSRCASSAKSSTLASLADTGQDVPAAVMATLDADGTVQVPFIGELTILVAGGVGEKDELIPLWSPPVSREIKLPPKWNDLLAAAAQH